MTVSLTRTQKDHSCQHSYVMMQYDVVISPAVHPVSPTFLYPIAHTHCRVAFNRGKHMWSQGGTPGESHSPSNEAEITRSLYFLFIL